MPTDVDLRFTIEYTGGSTAHYLQLHYYVSNVAPWGHFTYYSTSWTDASSSEAAIKIYCDGAVSAIIDDNISSYWQLAASDVTFDLGSVLGGVAGCRIYWDSDANYRPQAYKIQASVDGSTWDDVVVSDTQPPAGWAEYSWIARNQTRYLRILVTTHGSSGTRIHEFDYYQSSIWRHGHGGD